MPLTIDHLTPLITALSGAGYILPGVQAQIPVTLETNFLVIRPVHGADFMAMAETAVPIARKIFQEEGGHRPIRFDCSHWDTQFSELFPIEKWLVQFLGELAQAHGLSAFVGRHQVIDLMESASCADFARMFDVVLTGGAILGYDQTQSRLIAALPEVWGSESAYVERMIDIAQTCERTAGFAFFPPAVLPFHLVKGDPPAIEKAAQRIASDPHHNLQWMAALQLGLLKPREAAPALLRALDVANTFGEICISLALGLIEDPRAATHLRAKAQDEHSGKRAAAAWALGRLKDGGGGETVPWMGDIPWDGDTSVFDRLEPEVLGRLLDQFQVERNLLAMFLDWKIERNGGPMEARIREACDSVGLNIALISKEAHFGVKFKKGLDGKLMSRRDVEDALHYARWKMWHPTAIEMRDVAKERAEARSQRERLRKYLESVKNPTFDTSALEREMQVLEEQEDQWRARFEELQAAVWELSWP